MGFPERIGLIIPRVLSGIRREAVIEETTEMASPPDGNEAVGPSEPLPRRGLGTYPGGHRGTASSGGAFRAQL